MHDRLKRSPHYGDEHVVCTTDRDECEACTTDDGEYMTAEDSDDGEWCETVASTMEVHALWLHELQFVVRYAQDGTRWYLPKHQDADPPQSDSKRDAHPTEMVPHVPSS